MAINLEGGCIWRVEGGDVSIDGGTEFACKESTISNENLMMESGTIEITAWFFTGLVLDELFGVKGVMCIDEL